jgi:hypothetical protein
MLRASLLLAGAVRAQAPPPPLNCGQEGALPVGWGLNQPGATSGTPEYFCMLRRDYTFVPQDPAYYMIDLLVEPCSNSTTSGGRGKTCCMDTNVAGCGHHPDIYAGPDMQVAYFQNAHVSQCVGDFEYDINCGTYIEVHRKYDRKDRNCQDDEKLDLCKPDYEVLSDVKITTEFLAGYSSIYMRTTNLCTGEHELWWVVRTRSGPYVQMQRPFYVIGPSCSWAKDYKN